MKNFENSAIEEKYPKFKVYISTFFKSSEKWSLTFRTLSRNNNTNKIVESAMGGVERQSTLSHKGIQPETFSQLLNGNPNRNLHAKNH